MRRVVCTVIPALPVAPAAAPRSWGAHGYRGKGAGGVYRMGRQKFLAKTTPPGAVPAVPVGVPASALERAAMGGAWRTPGGGLCACRASPSPPDSPGLSRPSWSPPGVLLASTKEARSSSTESRSRRSSGASSSQPLRHPCSEAGLARSALPAVSCLPHVRPS